MLLVVPRLVGRSCLGSNEGYHLQEAGTQGSSEFAAPLQSHHCTEEKKGNEGKEEKKEKSPPLGRFASTPELGRYRR